MATALELTRKGWQHYLKNSRRSKQPELSPAVQKERERLLILVREAAAQLKSRFSVRRIVLIGSLAQDAAFTARSDVDLAVEGLVGDDYWEAWRLVEDIVNRPVDLIEIETAGESMLRTIERHGIEL